MTGEAEQPETESPPSPRARKSSLKFRSPVKMTSTKDLLDIIASPEKTADDLQKAIDNIHPHQNKSEVINSVCNGLTPLFCAIKHKKSEMIKLLLENRANAFFKNPKKASLNALEYSVIASNTEAVRILEKKYKGKLKANLILITAIIASASGNKSAFRTIPTDAEEQECLNQPAGAPRKNPILEFTLDIYAIILCSFKCLVNNLLSYINYSSSSLFPKTAVKITNAEERKCLDQPAGAPRKNPILACTSVAAHQVPEPNN